MFIKYIMKTVKFGDGIFMDLRNLEEIIPKLREFKKKFHLDIKLSLGDPIEVEYDEEKYCIDYFCGDLSFCDTRSKNILVSLVETRNDIQFELPDGTVVLKLDTLML